MADIEHDLAAFRSLRGNRRHLAGVDLRQFGIDEPETVAQNMGAVFAPAGVLRPAIAQACPPASWRQAMEAAATGEAAGRVVLTME